MISLDPRFNGPTDCGHGGVSAGRFAELVNPLAASVRFAAPIPLAPPVTTAIEPLICTLAP